MALAIIPNASELSEEELGKAKDFKMPSDNDLKGKPEKPTDFNLQEKKGWQKSLTDEEYFDNLSKEAIKKKEKYLANEKLTDEIHSTEYTDGLLRILKRLDTEEGKEFVKKFDINIEKITDIIISPISTYIERYASKWSQDYSLYESRHTKDYLEFLDNNNLLSEEQRMSAIGVLTKNNNDNLRDSARNKFPDESKLIDKHVVKDFTDGKTIDFEVMKNFSENYYQKILLNDENFQNYLINFQDKIKSDILLSINQKIDKSDKNNDSIYETIGNKNVLKRFFKDIHGISNEEKSEKILKIYEQIIQDLEYQTDRKILDHFASKEEELFSLNLKSTTANTENIQKNWKSVSSEYNGFSEKFMNEFISFKDLIRGLSNVSSMLNSQYQIESMFNYENFKKLFDSQKSEEIIHKTAVSYELFNDLIYTQKNYEPLSEEENIIIKEILDFKGNEALEHVVRYIENNKISDQSIPTITTRHPDFVAENMKLFEEKLGVTGESINKSAYEVMTSNLHNGDINIVLRIIEYRDKLGLEETKIQELVENSLLYSIRLGTIWRANEILEHRNELLLKNENITLTAKEACKVFISNGDIVSFISFIREKEKYFLKDDDVQDVLLSSVFTGIVDGHFNKIYTLPKELLLLVENEYYICEFQEKIGVSSQKIYNEFYKFKKEKDSVRLTSLIERINKNFSLIRSNILKDDINPKELNEDYSKEYLAKFIRLDETQWGNHHLNSMIITIENHYYAKKRNEIAPLKEYYQPSENTLINKVNSEKQDEYKHSEQFMARYQTIINSIRESHLLLEEKKPLTKLSDKINEKLLVLIGNLEAKLKNLDSPQARDNLSKNIDALKAIDTRDVKNFQENFLLLSQHKEFHESLRQFVFLMALEKNKNQRESIKSFINVDKPKLQDISKILEFVEDIVNQETMSKYFTEKKAVKAFREIINLRAFEDEMRRAQNQEIVGKTNMKFIPSRGIMMEFSGHIADACWASKYQSIAKEFPNLTSVIMVQNPDTKFERLVGAGILIETKDENDDPTLVIRGLNPIENVINQLSVEDFYKKFVEYAKVIAEKSGRKLAIVIDHCGGAASNRPVLFSYLANNVKIPDRHINLQSASDTMFNGYDITKDCYSIG